MAESKYRGRHRSARRTALSPQLLGAGLAVPTTATLVLSALSSGGSATAALAPTASHPLVDGTSADLAELAGVKAGVGTDVEQGVDRASRGIERQRLDAVTAENQRRAQTEATLAAGDQVVQVTAATGASADAAPAAPAIRVSGPHAWVKPLANYAITSTFGYRWGKLHPADDLAVPVGTPVRALSSGVVILAQWSGGYGNKIEIRYWDGTVSWYAHNSKLKVKAGDTVAPGQIVALSGDTGHSTGPHVHVEIHPNGGDPVNPMGWFKAHGIPL